MPCCSVRRVHSNVSGFKPSDFRRSLSKCPFSSVSWLSTRASKCGVSGCPGGPKASEMGTILMRLCWSGNECCTGKGEFRNHMQKQPPNHARATTSYTKFLTSSFREPSAAKSHALLACVLRATVNRPGRPCASTWRRP